MKIWILLLRGINVGGRNSLPMKELRGYMSSLGLEDVATYIQSGNAVFRASEEDAGRLPERLAPPIQEHHGFSPHVLVLSLDQWQEAMDSNPYPEAQSEPKSLHCSSWRPHPRRPISTSFGRCRRLQSASS